MTHPIRHRFITTGLCGLALLALGVPAHADTTWTAGSTVTLNSTLTVGDVLTIEPGVTVLLGNSVQIVIQPTGTMNVNGTEAQPVLFTKQAGAQFWNGIRFNGAGAQGTIDHAVIEKCWPHGIHVQSCSPRVTHSTIREVGYPFPASFTQPTYGIQVMGTGANPIIQHCTIQNIVGPSGSTGGQGVAGFSPPAAADGTFAFPNGADGDNGDDGGGGIPGFAGSPATGIEVAGNATATIAYNIIADVRGGNGGNGGKGGTGGKGARGGHGFSGIFNGNGGHGGHGGFPGSPGSPGSGGSAAAIRINQPAGQPHVFQNLIAAVQAGNGGQGGAGGTGGAGGNGGNGASCSVFLCSGGDGGSGGSGRNGTSGGFGGFAFPARALEVVSAAQSVIFANNTVRGVFRGEGNVGGAGGTGGAKGNGGSGGTAPASGFPGSGGPGGSTGSAGSAGGASAPGPVQGLFAAGAGSTQVQAWNNVIVPGNSYGTLLVAQSPSVIAADYNCFFSYLTISSGSMAMGGNNILDNPIFVDGPGADFHLQPGSPCLDAGSNPLIVVDLLDLDGDDDMIEPSPFDLDGLARVSNGVVDMGAYELQVAGSPPCPADFDGSHSVGGLDLAQILGSWTGAMAYSPCPPHSSLDLNQDCKVNGLDLAVLLGAWGPCPR